MPYQGGCSQVWSLPERLIRPSAAGKMIFPFSLGNITLSLFQVDFRCVHRLQLLRVSDQYVTLPNSSRVQSVSKYNPGKTFFPIDGFLSGLSKPQGDTQPMNQTERLVLQKWFSTTPFVWSFPIKQEILDYAKHSTEPESAHQLSFRPDCNTAEVPSFTPRTALSAIPFVSDRCGIDVQWFQERSSQACQNCQCKWL